MAQVFYKNSAVELTASPEGPRGAPRAAAASSSWTQQPPPDPAAERMLPPSLQEEGGARDFVFAPRSCLCCPAARTHRLALAERSATFSAEGASCLASQAHERVLWRDALLLRSSLGARSLARLLLFAALGALAGAAWAYEERTDSDFGALGVSLLVFAPLLLFWLLDRSAAFGAFTAAGAGAVLARAPTGLALAPGDVDAALQQGARAWAAERGGPLGNCDPTQQSLEPQRTTSAAVTLRWLCFPTGEDAVSARGGSNGSRGLFVTRRARGLCGVEMLSALETSAFLPQDVRYLQVTAGGRTLCGLFLALLPTIPLGFLVAYSFVYASGSGPEPGDNQRVHAIGSQSGPGGNQPSHQVNVVGSLVFAATAFVLAATIFLLVRWCFLWREELTCGLTEELTPTVRLPTGGGDAMQRAGFALMLGRAAAAGGARPSAPVLLEGTDGAGASVTLEVDVDRALVRSSSGSCCAACANTTTFVCRTSSLQLVYAASADIQGAVLRAVFTCAALLAALYVFRNDLDNVDYYAGAVLLFAALRILYLFCTRKTAVVLATVFTQQPHAGFLARLWGAAAGYPYEVSVSPSSTGASVDASEIVARIAALMHEAKVAEHDKPL